MSKKRFGRQEPTVWSTLPYKRSEGDLAIALYSQTNQELMPWQEKQIDAILAVDKDGNYIHRRYGLSISRRNGKTELYIARELYALEKEEKVLHTAHLATTAEDAAMRLAEALIRAGYEEVVKPVRGETYDHHFKFLKQKGSQVISIIGKKGQVAFRTRTARGALGTKCDVLIADEAQEFLVEHQNTLQYLISDSKNRQLLYCGTPPTAVSQGTVFKDFRNLVLSGKAKYSGWAEWSVPDITDVQNRDAWYECNPSLGYVFDEDAIELEIGTDDLDFNIQRLGLWISYNLSSAIKESDWQQTETDKLPKLKGKTYIGIKYGADGKNVALSVACKTNDDKIFISAYNSKNIRNGNQWIIQYLQSIKSLEKVVVDGKGNQEILIKEMKDNNLKKAVTLSGSDFLLANSQFEQAVFNDGLIHMPQPDLDIAVTNCEKKRYGSRGGFIYIPCSESIDITLMESTILAYWLCYNSKETKGQSVGY